ncbi:MAG TPA: hypothetical protein VMH02_08485 [Verrucomicrobiae bacterium]|nr:hypothetical protein [Verrucomicrobiae bacterium]
MLPAAAALLCLLLIAASGPIVATGQLLAYQDGYVFFTTGDGFHVSPQVVIRNASGTGAPIVPGPRVYARATFDAAGTVTELDLSQTPLPAQGDLADVLKFAVALSPPLPNPDLVPQTPAPGESAKPTEHFSGKPVVVVFTVQVPPNTPFTSTIYMTTDASGWNPNAVIMDRVDALHFRIIERLNSGTIFRYLYDRGSLQQEEVAENGMQRTPRQIVVTDSDVRAVNDTVYAWADMLAGGSQSQAPQGLPTPYNPAPFPNLPNGQPHPGGRPSPAP